LAIALQVRGHRATVITNPLFQELAEAQGLGFLPLGTIEDARATIADPDLWHPRKGFEVVARRAILPAVSEVYRHIEAHADSRTVVAASGIAFGARLAQERLGVPLATVHLQPSIVRSLVDSGMAGNIRISSSQPMWFKRAFFRLADWVLIDRALKRPLNEFRATLGLPPIDRVMWRWLHSTELVIGFFPEWFAPLQPDWPPHMHLVGFPLWDAGGTPEVWPPAVDRFLEDGEPPVVFTPGSAAATMTRYFAESVAAVRTLGVRAMLVTNFPEQVPSDLPPNVKVFGYLPFSRLLPKAALLVYHGGIGTLAQTIKAGIPHLVVPNGHDQFDNGWRIETLGLGRSLPQTKYRAAAVARVLGPLLDDREFRARCQTMAARVDGTASVARACDLIEGLARSRIQGFSSEPGGIAAGGREVDFPQ
jgi:UDP:flavonoid glycosyltransferase YjiC (YdhE family)